MNELPPEDRALIDSAIRDDAPERGARERVRGRLAAQLGATAGLGALGISAKTAAATTGSAGVSLTTKVLLIGALAGLGSGGAVMALRATESTTASAPAGVVNGARPTSAATAATNATSPPPGQADQDPSLDVASPPPSPATQPSLAIAQHAPPRVSVRAAAAAPQGVPSTATSTSTPTSLSLSQETRLVRDANSATRAGDPARALALLDEHARRFPRGVLVEERDAERVLATCAAGRRDEARALASRFLRTYPGSPMSGRVKSSCAE